MVILIGWIGRVLQGAWMALAGAVGWVARSIGRGARDVEPHHRRDGVGLLTLGVAIVLAGGLWVRMDNAAGHVIQEAVTGGIGSLAFLAPVLVALLAWRSCATRTTTRRPGGPRSDGLPCWSACAACSRSPKARRIRPTARP